MNERYSIGFMPETGICIWRKCRKTESGGIPRREAIRLLWQAKAGGWKILHSKE